MRLQRIIQYYRLRLLTIQATPRQIALGCAVGIFAAFLPILPFQIILGVFLAYMLGASKSAAAIGTLVSNPLNTIPLHMLYYQIGAKKGRMKNNGSCEKVRSKERICIS